MLSRPISVFTIFHSNNAEIEISSRLLEIMEESKLLFYGLTSLLWPFDLLR